MPMEKDQNACSLTHSSKNLVKKRLVTFLRNNLLGYTKSSGLWIPLTYQPSTLNSTLMSWKKFAPCTGITERSRTTIPSWFSGFAFQVSGSVLLFRLPESDQVKSNVKRVTIDYGAIQNIIKEWFYSYNMTIQVCSLFIITSAMFSCTKYTQYASLFIYSLTGKDNRRILAFWASWAKRVL